MKTIYDDPYHYAYTCGVPLDLARIACKRWRHHRRMMQTHPCKCPVCGSKQLAIELGSYEEGTHDFVFCEVCDNDFKPSDIKNIEYGSISPFPPYVDLVLYFSSLENKLEGRRMACGRTDDAAWLQFATEQITGKRISISSQKDEDIRLALILFDRFISDITRTPTDEHVMVYEHWLDCKHGIEKALEDEK